MRNNRIIGVFFFFMILVLSGGNIFAADNGYLSVTVNAMVKTGDPDKCGSDIIEWVESNGGYFTVKSDSRLVVRFPIEALPLFKEFLGEAGDELLDYSSISTDLREQMLTAESGIKAREEMLAQNMALVSRADFEGTLFLEQEILRLMNELDDLKGFLRKADNDRQMVYSEVNLNFQKEALPGMKTSSFKWMNLVDVASFLNNPFKRPSGSNFSLSGKAPEGFAFVGSGSRIYRAISPEGVRFQIQKEKNTPRKGADFWQESFVRQMELRGYNQVGEIEKIKTVKGEGFLVSWGLAYGASDYLYMTGVVIEKGRLYIIECSGEYDTVKKYKTSIDAFIKDFKW